MNSKLKEALGEELYNQVTEKLGDKKVDFLDDYVPKSRFKEKVDEVNTLKEQIGSLEKSSQEVEKLIKDNKETKEAYEKIKNQNEQLKVEYEAKLTNNQKRTLLNEELTAAGADLKDLREFLVSKINIEEVEIKEGKIRDIEEHIKKLKENYSNMFKETKLVGNDNAASGNVSQSNGITNPFVRGPSYNLTQQMKLYTTNRTEYERLKNLAK